MHDAHLDPDELNFAVVPAEGLINVALSSRVEFPGGSSTNDWISSARRRVSRNY
jgi:hypothetical protein